MTTLDDIQVGSLYTLSHDVQNPNVDRRRADYMIKTSVFPSGTLWVASHDFDLPKVLLLSRPGFGMGGQFHFAVESEVPKKKKRRLPHRERHKKWAEALVPHMTQVPIDTFDKICLVFDIRQKSLLKLMVDDKTLTLERLIGYLRKLYPELDPD